MSTWSRHRWLASWFLSGILGRRKRVSVLPTVKGRRQFTVPTRDTRGGWPLLTVETTEYSQSGNGHFLAYIPSWWKNQPSLVGGGGGVHSHLLSLYLPSHTKFVRSSWEADTLTLFLLYPYMCSVVETEMNGDSKSTNEIVLRGGSLGLSYRSNRFLFCLGCSSRLSTKYVFPRRTLFEFLCPPSLSKLDRQPCWVVCLLIWISLVPTVYVNVLGRRRMICITWAYNVHCGRGEGFTVPTALQCLVEEEKVYITNLFIVLTVCWEEEKGF